MVGLEHLSGLPADTDDESKGEQEDAGLLEAEAAEEEAAEENGEIGKGGAEVGLFEDEEHGDADEGEGLADISPGEIAAGEAPEVAGDGDDEDEFDPFGGLEVDAAGELDPALAAEDPGADGEDGKQGGDRDGVGGRGDVDEGGGSRSAT